METRFFFLSELEKTKQMMNVDFDEFFFQSENLYSLYRFTSLMNWIMQRKGEIFCG